MIKTKDGLQEFGRWLASVRKDGDGEIKDSRLDAYRVKTAGHMEAGDDSAGGFFLPEEWAAGIYEAAALEGAIARPRARVFPTTREKINVRTLVDSDRSSNLFGGITFTWLGEAGEKASTIMSTASLGALGLIPKKLVGSLFTANELEEDYGAFGQYMQTAFGVAVRFIEDERFIWGTGRGQPVGVMNSTALITLARQQQNNIVYEDLTAMVKRLLPMSWNTAVWLINPDIVEKWFSLDTVENNVKNYIDTNERKVLGFPYIVTEKCQTLGTSGDIILVDWSHYAIADRGIEVAGSRHANYSSQGFITDETFWRVVLRTDGQPTLSAAITPYLGANTLSPFVALTDQTS